MKCPHCGVEVAFTWETVGPAYGLTPSDRIDSIPGTFVKLERAYCPGCRQLTIRAEFIERALNANLPGVPQVAIRPERRWHDWVIPKFVKARELSSEAPQEVRTDFDEATKVLPFSPKASAAMSRRLVQHILRDYCGVKKSDLFNEIGEFIDRPGTPSHIADVLDGVRQVGNYAAHPMKYLHTGEVIDVEPGEAEWNLDTVENLVDFVFVQPLMIERRRDAMNQKLVAAGKPPLQARKAVEEIE